MRINDVTKSVDIEERDFNFVFGSYIQQYIFYMRGQDPDEILIPLYESVPHPTNKGKRIKIRYVPPLSPEAIDIKIDGSNIPTETTVADEQVADQVEETIHNMNEVSKELEAPEPPSQEQVAEEDVGESTAVAEVAEPPKWLDDGRVPKQPERVTEGHPDNMQARRPGDDRILKHELMAGDGTGDDPKQPAEPYDKQIERDADGNPIVKGGEQDEVQ